MSYSVIVFGATGLVGRTMLKVLEERNFPISNLKLLASPRSAGIKINYRGVDYKVEAVSENSFDNFDIALFSAGGDASRQWAPIAAKKCCIVIDNSSAWRMDETVPLVVPEVNPHHLSNHNNIIANPNCSTIQMVVALKPIENNLKLRRVIVSTYQSITGAGQKGLDKLMNELGDENLNSDSYRIAYSTMFHSFTGSGFTDEEVKMKNETRKIMDLPHLKIAVTCVRIPTVGGHGESINFETEKKSNVEEIRGMIAKQDGIILMDSPSENIYPTPLHSKDQDPVYVGRIREDDSAENSYYMWVVADNLRKGAATNAVHIAEKLVEMNLIKQN